MIESILAWMSGARADAPRRPRRDDLRLALTALLVEAAHSDEGFDEAERSVIERLLESRFNLSQSDTAALISAGERESAQSTELFRFTRIVNERLSCQERVELVEMLWEVAYADGVLDPYEDSLLRRVAGLIYVPDRERGLARRRILDRRARPRGLIDPF